MTLIYASSANNAGIKKYDTTTGTVTTVIGTGSYARMVVDEESGTVYATNGSAGKIIRITNNGIVSDLATGQDQCYAITMDQKNKNVFWGMYKNSSPYGRVNKWDGSSVSTIVSGWLGGFGDLEINPVTGNLQTMASFSEMGSYFSVEFNEYTQSGTSVWGNASPGTTYVGATIHPGGDFIQAGMDRGPGSIVKVTSGAFTAESTVSPGRLADFAIHDDGTRYVLRHNSSTLYLDRVAPSPSSLASHSHSGDPSNCNMLIESGDVYWTDYTGGNLKRWSSGTVTNVITGFSGITGIAKFASQNKSAGFFNFF